MRLLKNLSILTVSLLLMACASSSPPLIIKDNPPIVSLQLCPDIQKDGNYKDFGQTLQKLVDTIGMYNTCAANHAGLVEYVNKKE